MAIIKEERRQERQRIANVPIDDEIIATVQEAVSMDSLAWDTIDPRDIIAASVRAVLARREDEDQ